MDVFINIAHSFIVQNSPLFATLFKPAAQHVTRRVLSFGYRRANFGGVPLRSVIKSPNEFPHVFNKFKLQFFGHRPDKFVISSLPLHARGNRATYLCNSLTFSSFL